MKIVQQHRGWVSDEALHDIGELLGMSDADLDGVATFYNLIFRRPVGRHVIYLCDSVSCWIMGLRPAVPSCLRTARIQPGETTADERFTLLADRLPRRVRPCTGHDDRRRLCTSI